MKKQEYSITATENANGVITAFIDQLPALLVQGNTMAEVKHKMTHLHNKYLTSLEFALKNAEFSLTKMEFKKCDGNGKR